MLSNSIEGQEMIGDKLVIKKGNYAIGTRIWRTSG
jgi:hypothetical protein